MNRLAHSHPSPALRAPSPLLGGGERDGVRGVRSGSGAEIAAVGGPLVLSPPRRRGEGWGERCPFGFRGRNRGRWRAVGSLSVPAALGLAALAAFAADPPASRPAGTDDKFDPKVQEFVKRFKAGGSLGDQSPAPKPADALAQFKVVDGLSMDLVASEPAVRQPLYMNFDERGRLWVVNYVQFPFPAGLKIVKYDQYLRAVFDKVPPPPPNHFKGADYITIHEDTDGNGSFDRTKVFLDGLNMARSVVTGRGGVWVLHPPYLMFYPDANRDDIPDGPPRVVLSGFGLEDTHSGANSLAWGPDGWLYGAHGSTCTADVRGVKFLGQAIWRYNPRTDEFEVFAEGGGNTYSIEFDAKGRVFSGTNYGDTRGLHYAQGALYIKGWAKHGPAMSPYRFGWFEHMKSTGYKPRFPQTMLIYEGGAMPKYEGQVIAGMALTSRYQAAKLARDTSSFRSDDTDTLIESSGKHFRPVDTKVGPDGAIYIADWCDTRLSHLDPNDTWDKETGRIWRLKSPEVKAVKPFDIGKASNDELIKLLAHPNKFQRQTALRVLWDRNDKSLVTRLQTMVLANLPAGERARPGRTQPASSPVDPVRSNPSVQKVAGGTPATPGDQLALESFWAVNACGGFDDAFAAQCLAHPDEFIRYWTVRLLGDRRKPLAPALHVAMFRLARDEKVAEVRSQLASTATRLPGNDGVAITRELLLRAEDEKDIHIPLLLWWAVESKVANPDDRNRVMQMLLDSTLWEAPIVKKFIISRLGQRFTAERSEKNLRDCELLFQMAPNPAAVDELIKGMEAGLQGDPVKSVPPALATKVAELWATREHTPLLTSFAVRLGHAPAADTALARLTDAKTPEADRRKTIALLAERRVESAVPAFLKLLRFEKSEALRLDLVTALQRFGTATIAHELLDLYPGFSGRLRDTAQAALASRADWARRLLAAVDEGQLKKEQVAIGNLLAIAAYKDTACDALIKKHWGRLNKTTEEKQDQIAKIRTLLKTGKGDEKAGREVFKMACAACHKLNNDGAAIGPDLTGYERDNLDFILPAIVDPSLAIREEYTAFNVTTHDGQSLTGLLVEVAPRAVTVMDLVGNKTALPREQVKDMQASALSLMPEGLLDAMSEQQVRDLFAYFMAGARPGKK